MSRSRKRFVNTPWHALSFALPVSPRFSPYGRRDQPAPSAKKVDVDAARQALLTEATPYRAASISPLWRRQRFEARSLQQQQTAPALQTLRVVTANIAIASVDLRD